jgi:hypothetical protein
MGLSALRKLPNYFPIFGLTAAFSLMPCAVQAELSAEHKQRVRGEMREIWSKMTPEEREFLRREYVESQSGLVIEAEQSPPPSPYRKNVSSLPPTSALSSSISSPTPSNQFASDRRQMSPEDHSHLRRQLRDVSLDGR